MRLRTDDITWREIDGDLVVLDLRTSTYLLANASGAVLMRQLAEGRTLKQLTQALVEEFDVPGPQARRDVQTFVEDLSRRDLLERVHRAPVQTPAITPTGESGT